MYCLCNSLIHGFTNKLQRVQTSVARLVLPNLSQQPATALLCEPPVNSRIIFKFSHTNYSPPVNLLICACCYTMTLYGRLINFFLDVPRFSAEFGERSFSYWAATVWNGLPLNIRLSPTFDTFKRRRKTHLFK